jgi:hypothetical protein
MLNDEQKPRSAFSIHHSALVLGVTDGTRTRDVQDHNLALYQLSYGHRESPDFIARWGATVNAPPGGEQDRS